MKITKKLRQDLHNIRKQLEDVQAVYYEHIDEDLCGACALGALLTYRYLKKCGYKPKFVYGNHHCLVKCGNYLIDLTATQFDILNPPVLIDYFDNLDFYYNTERNKFRIWKKPVAGAFRYWEDQNPYNFLHYVNRGANRES